MHVMLVDAGARLRMGKQLIESHHDPRRVFVDLLGRHLPNAGSWLEVDEFDNEYTVYLIASADRGEHHLASVRLLPTTRPHMLSTIFADLNEDGPVTGEDVWEVSRFLLSPLGMRGVEIMRLGQYIALAHAEFAQLNGIRCYTMVVETNRVAMVVAMGWQVRPLCLPREREGKQIVSMKVTIDDSTLSLMRRRFGIAHAVLENAAGSVES